MNGTFTSISSSDHNVSGGANSIKPCYGSLEAVSYSCCGSVLDSTKDKLMMRLFKV